MELVRDTVRVEWECFWVNLRKDNKVSESKMAVFESNMAEFKMAAIINLSENEWVKFFLYKMAELRMADIKISAIIRLSQNEWMKFFCANVGNYSWQLWVSLRERTKMAEFKMAAIIKLSQNEWVKFFLCKMAESKMAEFKMAAIIKLSENEWVWVRLNWFELEFCAKWLNPRWQNSRWKNSRWLPSLSLSDGISLTQSQNGVRVFWVNLREDNKVFESKMAVSESNMSEFKMADIIKLNENEWVWVSLNKFESEFCAKWLNPRWQNSRWKNSRWLPSLS